MQSFYLTLTSDHIMRCAARELRPEQYERMVCILLHWHRRMLSPAVAEYMIEDLLERHGSAELLMELRNYFAYAESLTRLHRDVKAGTVWEATDIFPPGVPHEPPPNGAMPPPRKLPRRR